MGGCDDGSCKNSKGGYIILVDASKGEKLSYDKVYYNNTTYFADMFHTCHCAHTVDLHNVHGGYFTNNFSF